MFTVSFNYVFKRLPHVIFFRRKTLYLAIIVPISVRFLIKQLEKASKIAKKAVIIAEEELEGNFYTVKNLETGEQIKTTEL